MQIKNPDQFRENVRAKLIQKFGKDMNSSILANIEIGVYNYAIKHSVNATLRLTSEEETGAEHCQHDNPTLGQELMIDWLADVFKIYQTKLLFFPG